MLNADWVTWKLCQIMIQGNKNSDTYIFGNINIRLLDKSKI